MMSVSDAKVDSQSDADCNALKRPSNASAAGSDEHEPMKKCTNVNGSITSNPDQVNVKFASDSSLSTDTAVSDLTPADCPYKIKAVKPIFHGRWMGAKQVDFTDPRDGSDGIWQVGYRSSKIKGAAVDGVLIVPLIKWKNGDKKFIVIKQYRIPIMCWCLEFPAGLLDPNESISECALRELKEETGYTAHSVKYVSHKLALDPGLVDATANALIVEIDGDLPENQNPSQNLMEGEHIERFLVPHNKLFDFVKDKNKDGLTVEMCLWSFAAAYDMALNI